MPKKSEIEKAALPIEQASGMPNWFYTSPDAIMEEKRKVFSPGWVGIGFAKDVPEPGDVKPVEFLGDPFIISHGRDGVVRVFHNACRHRGVKLVQEAGKTTGLLRCPYHAWCYSTEGALKQTPHVGGPGIHTHEAIDKSKLGLIEVRSHTYLDVVFVNISGEAPPFEEYYANALERWQDFDKPIFHGGEESSFKLSVNTNWKLAVENYCESYHLPFIHPGLNEVSKLEDHANILGDGPFAGQLTRAFTEYADENGRNFASFAPISERWNKEAEYIVFYPNVMLGVHKDHTFSIILEPVSESQTLEHIELYYASNDMRDEDHAAMRQDLAAFWKEVFSEDVGVVEAMQDGRKADGFDGGHFSPVMDESTHHFHRWMAQHFI
ncbi:MAG: aromatic ring-hydroxylating dioxygenase subunit alpha [Rhizobiaceae bacterium]|nr:aromatic ring-hydroxylating dioxygenase subunit alpha [Rhizobiaceae bacterium]